RRRQRAGGVRLTTVDAGEHLRLRNVETLGDIRDRRRPTEFLRHHRDQAADLQVQLLACARHPYAPALVPEMTLDLAEDRRHGVVDERRLAVRVEAVDRLDETDRADLDEVVEAFAPPGEPGSGPSDHREARADDIAAHLVALWITWIHRRHCGQLRRDEFFD